MHLPVLRETKQLFLHRLVDSTTSSSGCLGSMDFTMPLRLPAGTDHLSICLESKDTEKSGTVERSCWCLFRLVLVAEGPGSQPLYRDSYGRFAADSKTGDNTSLGWNDFITMEEFS